MNGLDFLYLQGQPSNKLQNVLDKIITHKKVQDPTQPIATQSNLT